VWRALAATAAAIKADATAALRDAVAEAADAMRTSGVSEAEQGAVTAALARARAFCERVAEGAF